MVQNLRRVLASLFIPSAMVFFGMPGCGSHVELAKACTPHERETCYSGPDGTEGMGHCRAGLRTCADDGSGYGPCVDEVLPSPEVCTLPGDEDCDGKSAACTGNTAWAKRYSGAGYRFPRNISADKSSGVAVSIEFDGTLDFGTPIGVLATSTDYSGGCVFKLNDSGDPVFATLLDGTAFMLSVASGTAGNTIGLCNIQNSLTLAGEVFTVANTQDALLFSLDASGGLSFSKQIIGSNYLQVEGVARSPEGDLLIGGYSSSSLDLGGGVLKSDGPGVTFLGRFDSLGNHIWSKVLPHVFLRDALFDGQGNIVLSGDLYDKANFGGDTLEATGSDDHFVVKLDKAGQHLWSKQFGPIGTSEWSNLTVMPDDEGNVYMAGSFVGTWDFGDGPVQSKAVDGSGDAFFVKLDPEGNYQWGKYFGTGGTQSIYSIATGPTGSVAIGARFSGGIDFGGGALFAASPLTPDIAVAKYTKDGNLIWSKRFGAGNYLFLDGIALGSIGQVYMTGTVAGDIDFGSGMLKAQGYGKDLFVVQLEP